MLHPDYQYSPLLVEPMASMIAFGVYDIVLGSRILGGGALKGGMPRHKYVANRMLTLVQNLALGAKLSEYHTGFRAYSREMLLSLPLESNSDDFVFDNQLLAQCIYLGARIGEVSCPTRYFPEASSINLRRSTIYGLGVLKTTAECVAARWGLYRRRIFQFPPLRIRPQSAIADSQGGSMSRPRVEGLPILRLGGLTAAALVIHGYHLGVEDAEIYVPTAKKLLDPSLYPYATEFFLSHGHLSLYGPLLAWTSKLTHLPIDWAIFSGTSPPSSPLWPRRGWF